MTGREWLQRLDNVELAKLIVSNCQMCLYNEVDCTKDWKYKCKVGIYDWLRKEVEK